MVLAALSLVGPFFRLRWVTRSTLDLLHQTSTQTSPCSSQTASSGELAAAELCSGGQRRRPRALLFSAIGSKSDGHD